MLIYAHVHIARIFISVVPERQISNENFSIKVKYLLPALQAMNILGIFVILSIIYLGFLYFPNVGIIFL